jgi:hypothetical protein
MSGAVELAETDRSPLFLGFSLLAVNLGRNYRRLGLASKPGERPEVCLALTGECTAGGKRKITRPSWHTVSSPLGGP